MGCAAQVSIAQQLLCSSSGTTDTEKICHPLACPQVLSASMADIGGEWTQQWGQGEHLRHDGHWVCWYFELVEAVASSCPDIPWEGQARLEARLCLWVLSGWDVGQGVCPCASRSHPASSGDRGLVSCSLLAGPSASCSCRNLYTYGMQPKRGNCLRLWPELGSTRDTSCQGSMAAVRSHPIPSYFGTYRGVWHPKPLCPSVWDPHQAGSALQSSGAIRTPQKHPECHQPHPMVGTALCHGPALQGCVQQAGAGACGKYFVIFSSFFFPQQSRQATIWIPVRL